MNTINLVCSIVALAAGAGIFGRYLLARRIRASVAPVVTVTLDPEQVIVNYSIYIEGKKVGACTAAGLIIDAEETQLSFSQIVPLSAPHLRMLLRAFRNREQISVAVGPIDTEIVDLKEMRVASLILDADMQCGTTTLDTTLTGPTLATAAAIPISDETTVPVTGSATAN